MSIISGTSHSSGGFYDFPINQSLRFDGSSYLSRTPTTAGNRKTWTWSGWVKRSDVGSSDNLVFQAGSGTPWFICGFGANVTNSFFVSFNAGSSGVNFYTDALFRDTSAWYHIVLAVDTTQSTSTDRVKIYVNGTQASTTENSSVSPNYDTQVNNTQAHYIGRNQASNSYFNGYLANIQFIGGQALDASYFGETKGVWIPKEYTGSYGTNGFRLAFNLSDFNTSGSAVSDPYGSAINLPDGNVADASGSGNHWQVN